MAMIVNRVAAGVAGTVALLAAAVLSAPSSVAQAVAERTTGPQAQGAPAGDSGGFIAESRQKLALIEEELVGLAEPLGSALEKSKRPGLTVESQRLTVEATETRSKSAQLKREAAEIALEEYRDGTYKQERAAAEAELKSAQDALKQAEHGPERARELIAKVKPLLQGSTTDLVIQWNLEAVVYSAELQKKSAQLLIEQVQHKLKILDEFGGEVRISRLRSDVDKARSDELAKRATAELEKTKLTRLQRIVPGRPRLSDRQRRILKSLEQAVPLDANWADQLEKMTSTGRADESRRKDISALEVQLRAIVDQERGDQAAEAWMALKSMIDGGTTIIPQASAERSPVSRKVEIVAAAGGEFLAVSRAWLKELRSEIVRLGRQIPQDITWQLRDQLTNQQISERSVSAGFENAKLTREVAEIAVKEYEVGIYPQDSLRAEGEVTLAESEVARANDLVPEFKNRLAALKSASHGSVQDLYHEYQCQDKLNSALQRLPKARLALEAARTKFDQLQKYTRAKVVTELKAEVEKARADELDKQAAWEAEKAKTKALEQAIARASRPNRMGRAFVGLDQAMKVAERLQNKLDSTKNDGEADAAARPAITSLLHELAATIESARAAQATLAWAKLKEQVRSLDGDQ
jgi:hypothetical protein